MSRDKYLKPFTTIFRKADLDKDGILSEEELIELLTYTECYKDNIREQAKKIFNILDPNNNKSFTFSDLVNFFSKEIIDYTDEDGKKLELNVLDKLSNY
jgi:Ca2+-binding EF-hand superfamily protein